MQIKSIKKVLICSLWIRQIRNYWKRYIDQINRENKFVDMIKNKANDICIPKGYI